MDNKLAGKGAAVVLVDEVGLSADEQAKADGRRKRLTRAMRLAVAKLVPASIAVVNRHPESARWFCLQVASGRDFSVQKAMEDAGVEVLSPREKYIVLKKGRSIDRERPVLPGYLLVHFVPSDDAFHALKTHTNIIDFVRNSAGYHMMRDKDVAVFKGTSDIDVSRMPTDKTIGDGTRAKVIMGHFTGFECVVLSVKWSREAHARVQIVGFGIGWVVDKMPLAFLKKL